MMKGSRLDWNVNNDTIRKEKRKIGYEKVVGLGGVRWREWNFLFEHETGFSVICKLLRRESTQSFLCAIWMYVCIFRRNDYHFKCQPLFI